MQSVLYRVIASGDDPAAEGRVLWLRRMLSLFTLALLIATWRLWTPLEVFPRVPLVWAAASIPAVVQWLLMSLTAASLVVGALAPGAARIGRTALRTFAGALFGLIVCDQHRIQPWAYQAILVGLALANLAPGRAVAVLRMLTISIYFYSGCSKFDYEFLHTLGPQLLSTLLACLGAQVENWPAGGRLAGAALFPLGEMALAAGFCWRRTRRAALCGSLALHAALLLILGPWGLHHSLGVLLWNGYFMVQNVLLFGDRAPGREAAGSGAQFGSIASSGRIGLVASTTQAIVAAALLLPLVEPLGWCDAWPAWSLYSPNSERVVIFVHRRALDRLGQLAQYVGACAEDDPWIRLSIDRWSLDKFGVPIYPQNRFQLGVAEAIGSGCHLDHRIRAVEFGRASRWTGRRKHRTLSGRTEIAVAADGFWLNAHPDMHFGPEHSAGGRRSD